MNRAIKLSWWQMGLVTIAISALGGLASRKSSKMERKVYTTDLKQAPWAPPAWLFGPAWTFNNYFVLRALKQLLLSENIPEKKKLLYLQILIWGIFFSFGYVYFNKKSPVLGAAWTIADAALAALSFITANKEDKKLSHNYLPLLSWTAFASSVAAYQALKNPDPIFNTKALLN